MPTAAKVVKWKRTGKTLPDGTPVLAPAMLETLEEQRVKLKDGTIRPIRVRSFRRARGDENYTPSQPPPEVLAKFRGDPGAFSDLKNLGDEQ